MTKKDIESLIKNRKENEVADFFKKLPNHFNCKQTRIYVMIVSGIGCDSPIISKKDNIYEFDTYGYSFKNWREWDKCGSYGTCGGYGSTDRLKCVANSCISYNRENGRVSLITQEVYDDLKKDGYIKIIKLKNGFH